MRLQIPFVLASGSPRRRRLLEQLGVSFEVDARDIDETVPAGADPAQVCEVLALRKAQDASVEHPRALVLGSDTIVVLNGSILGKPADEDEACEMLRGLSGATHTVYTGIALVHSPTERSVTASEATRVTFGEIGDDEITAYVGTGSPMDKAGAYGIQDDRGALFIDQIDGDYYNVVGLPLRRLYLTLRTSFPDLLAPDFLTWSVTEDTNGAGG